MKRILVFLLACMLLNTPINAEEQETYTPEELVQIWHQVIAMMREAECYPYVELRRNDRGYEVMFLQARLAQLNYYGKAIDPQFGPGTYSAMRMFEQAHGLPVNGIASVGDQQLLFSSKAKAYKGTPAGLESGETVPPDGTGWPDEEPPEWWHPFPTIPTVIPDVDFPDYDPIITPHPELTGPGIDMPDYDLPEAEPIITPNPGLFQPGVDIPGLNPGLVVDPDKLITNVPVEIPEFFDFPHP